MFPDLRPRKMFAALKSFIQREVSRILDEETEKTGSKGKPGNTVQMCVPTILKTAEKSQVGSSNWNSTKPLLMI